MYLNNFHCMIGGYDDSDMTENQSSGSGLMIVVGLVILLAIAAAVYFFLLTPSATTVESTVVPTTVSTTKAVPTTMATTMAKTTAVPTTMATTMAKTTAVPTTMATTMATTTAVPTTMASTTTPQNLEVFAIGGYDYTNSQAQQTCANYNATVATTAQLNTALQYGADWCSTGWVSDKPDAVYPSTINLIQGCGGGVAGLKTWTPPSNMAGVNCYGIKPTKGNNNILPFSSEIGSTSKDIWNQPKIKI